jgi:hypothetical protein
VTPTVGYNSTNLTAILEYDYISFTDSIGNDQLLRTALVDLLNSTYGAADVELLSVSEATPGDPSSLVLIELSVLFDDAGKLLQATAPSIVCFL